MASSPNSISVDWTMVKIWCCGEFHHIGDIAGHAEQKHSNGEKMPNLHIGDEAEQLEQVHSNGDKVVIEDIRDVIEHAVQVHSNGEKEVIDENSNKKMKQPHMINVDKKDENYNSVVSINKFQNSTRKNDKMEENRNYYCDSCDYKTTQKRYLTIHIENKHLGIRHECEVCQFRSTTKAGLNRHRKRIHGKAEMKKEIGNTDTFRKVATEIPSLFLNAEIKQEVVDPTVHSLSQNGNVDPMVQPNVTATLSLSQNENVNVAEIKQEIVSETPILLDNQMVSVGVDVLTEVKEEVDEENLQVPGWRIFPQFEHPPLNERRKASAEGKTEELDNVFLEEQAAIVKLHAKLEKKEKESKKWDAQWRKRQVDIQKLKAAKDRSSGKDVKMEEEEIEELWPNSDYVTDLVVVDVGQEPMPAKKSPSK